MRRIPHQKPKRRSDFRLMLGKLFFTARRHAVWLWGGIKFADKSDSPLPFEYCSHSTPLFRKLKDVDMHMQENKVANLKIAVSSLHGATLYPGETLSFWKLVGKPTKRKGYKRGMVLKNGTVASATGGGLCQLSNMLFWLTIHTPLSVVERHRHGYDVFPDSNRTQPFGSGATCFYNYGDLMVRNDTPYAFQLRLEVGVYELTGAWMCEALPLFRYEVYESEHVMQSEFWGGYTRHNVIRRKKYAGCGELVDDEFVVENHAVMMYSPFLGDSEGVAASENLHGHS